MVSSLDGSIQQTTKTGDDTAEERYVLPIGRPIDITKAIVVLTAGEGLGQVLLALAKNVNNKWKSWTQSTEEARTMIDTHEHQRRVERDGGKRAYGHSVRLTVIHAPGHDSDAGWKEAAHMTELGRGDLFDAPLRLVFQISAYLSGMRLTWTT